MIDKYQLLYSNIKKMQEERLKEQQEQKRNEECSFNPFSIASANNSHQFELNESIVTDTNKSTGKINVNDSDQLEVHDNFSQHNAAQKKTQSDKQRNVVEMVDVQTSPFHNTEMNANVGFDNSKVNS